MNLTINVLKELYNNNYSNNNEISNRFKEIEKLFNEILNTEVKIDGNEVKINNTTLKYEGKTPTISYFGPAKDNMTQPEGYEGVRYMADIFEDYKTIIIQIGSLLGGFDFNNHKMMDKYRIISNAITSKDDFSKSLSTAGQFQHPSSHFADNTYFFNIMYFIQNSNDDNIIELSNMVLRYYNNYFKIGNDDNYFSQEYENQKEVLKYRFPPKFLWMWANKSTVIHPISLMAFRNFLNTKYGKQVLENIDTDKKYTPKDITNEEFNNFKDTWEKISNKILDDLGIERTDVDAISKISKLISEISIEETDIKNISDLLETGNKAVILWGPPGTGKTYESMEVVKKLLEIDYDLTDEDIEKKYLFSKGDTNRNDKGFYEIVQFHPNYTYQDFIGGISPKLDDKGTGISYVLRDGKFKMFCDEAGRKENIDSGKKFIFIIDEINRAELSAVFGELLFALEYRGKSIDIPHFGDFVIPGNVYIIGTMNNVDKSLVTFDLALRRRFGFFKLMPKLEIINDVLSEIVENESLKNYVEKCKQLNILVSMSNNKITNDDTLVLVHIDYKKLLLELGEDYQIGQAYFLKIKDFLDQEKIKRKEHQIITSFELEKLWIYNIEPLLEEYLGMSIEDDIQTKLNGLKEEFLKDT
jgi:MoxR-like ATPase